jgi:hypothetical protein
MFKIFVSIFFIFLKNPQNKDLKKWSHNYKMLKKSCENSQQLFFCDLCDYKTSRKYDYANHLFTTKHKKNEKHKKKVATPRTEKSHRIYYCENCDYSSSNTYNFEKHKLTAKHLKNEKLPETRSTFFVCYCGKKYKFLTGLTRHKIVCEKVDNVNSIQEVIQKNNELLKDNKEFKDLLIEQNKKIMEIVSSKPTVINNTQNNTQNNMTFNLNYFLNDKCKDAVNMADFIDSLKVTLEDLENTGKNGLVKSLTHCITRELEKMDIYSRPIHCLDKSRKVIHIKNENKWQRDTDGHTATKKVISKINHKMNVLQIPKWKNIYPSCEIASDTKNTIYLKIVQNMIVDGDDNTYDKVITNISNKMFINKGIQKNMRIGNNDTNSESTFTPTTIITPIFI